VNNPEDHLSSSEMVNTTCITSYQWSVVTTSLSCNISKILPLIQCTWLLVTMIRFSVSIRQLKLENVAQKYHVMAALPNIGVEKSAHHSEQRQGRSTRSLAVMVRKRCSQMHLF